MVLVLGNNYVVHYIVHYTMHAKLKDCRTYALFPGAGIQERVGKIFGSQFRYAKTISCMKHG